MHSLKLLFCGLLLSILAGCQNEKQSELSFYHWKSRTSESPAIDSALVKISSPNLYMHYFDVDIVEGNEIFPIYVLRDVTPNFKSFNIIPVIFITNRTLKQEVNLQDLAKKIKELTTQIHTKHFQSPLKTIQLDCDWTSSTMNKFFELVELMKTDFEVISTIRLHQIKYKDKTGVPPADKGVLMLYNVGDLKKEDENSILESSIIQDYISSNTSYPLELDLALPIFSQTVIKNISGEIRLLNISDAPGINSDSTFQEIGNDLYEVKRDTLYHGFYLSEGYRLKLETLSENEVITAYEIVKNSKLDIDEVILYHLDEDILNNTNVDLIISRL